MVIIVSPILVLNSSLEPFSFVEKNETKVVENYVASECIYVSWVPRSDESAKGEQLFHPFPAFFPQPPQLPSLTEVRLKHYSFPLCTILVLTHGFLQHAASGSLNDAITSSSILE